MPDEFKNEYDDDFNARLLFGGLRAIFNVVSETRNKNYEHHLHMRGVKLRADIFIPRL